MSSVWTVDTRSWRHCWKGKRYCTRDHQWGYHAVKGLVNGEGTKRKENTTHSILSSRVEFTSVVTVRNVQQVLVNEPDNLDVSRALNDLNTLQSAIRNETSTMAFLGTPGNFDTLRVTNCGVGSRRSEETKVCKEFNNRIKELCSKKATNRPSGS